MRSTPLTTGLLAITLVLAGCGGGSAQIEQELASAEYRLGVLEDDLNKGLVTNAQVLKSYVSQARAKRPELSGLLDTMEADAGTEGAMFQGLKRRLDEAKSRDDLFADWQERLVEIQAIRQALDPLVYNDALSDVVNVVADLAELPRVNAMKRETEAAANNSKSFGAGSQLIGNPSYGYWQQGSGGSFWVWYGQYRLLSDLFGGPSWYYNDWARYRPYSYYSDVGRRTYTSPSSRRSQLAVENRTRKTFGQRGQGFQSPYAKTRTGASNLSRASTAQSKSVFKSSYASSSSSSRAVSPGARSSSSRTSRSSFGGK